MRFIGSKAALLQHIDAVIKKNTTGRERVFCDIFSGTGIVARYFKPKYEVHSNDALHFSYVIQKATIENNEIPQFAGLRRAGIAEPFSFLEETPVPPAECAGNSYFIAENYAPNQGCQRMYLSESNALRIDFIRQTIETWKQAALVTEMEYYYLLAGLIEAVPSVSNITGTYGAYLKRWDKRTFKSLELARLEVTDNRRCNKSYNLDANRLIGEIEGDILYIDPPYNTRQYAPNYHLLETISKYDNPKIYGVTGMRPYEGLKSRFCIRGEVKDAFEDLIQKAKFSNIVMSYSTDGLMSEEEIEAVLKKCGRKNTYQVYKIPYRQYVSKKTQKTECLFEYLFYIKKHIPKKTTVTLDTAAGGGKAQPVVDQKKYIKSPMNYIGGKYKLLPQIIPRFPGQIRTFVDLFSGGCNVAINVKAQRILCNDINSKIIELFRVLKERDISDILEHIEGRIAQYRLSKQNEAGFIAFRNDYNQTKDPLDLYTLTCYSFNYQFRFNNDLEYNNPFGRNRSQFSLNMRKNLIAFVNRLKEIQVEFTNRDFKDIDLNQLGPADFIYCDPPYFITTGTYNDGNRGFQDWKEPQERELYRYLDEADRRGIRFALSNVLSHKGRENAIALSWAARYRIIDLNYSYANASYNTKKGESREVLIVNY